MAAKKYYASRLFNKFLKMLVKPYMKHLFDYSIDNTQIQSLKPPYIILANHTNFWDPFLLALCVPDPVYYLASDAYFRSPILKYLLRLVGAIPKTKFLSDPSSIRAINGVVKNKNIIGIFPEGRRNWDGTTLPLLRPTAKLIKSLNIPVVSVLFKGAYLSMPRWASSTRKGELKMTLSVVLKPEDIEMLSVDGIFLKITGSLLYDEYEYQRKHKNSYIGRNKAEKLELFLFCCPECKNIGRLTSKGDVFTCGNCGYTVTYNSFGFFETDGAKLYFDNPKDWNLWELEYLEAFMNEQVASDNQLPLLQDHNIILRTGRGVGPLDTLSADGSLYLYDNRLEYYIGKELLKSFPVREIRGINIQFNNQLEFICDHIVYRFNTKTGVMGAYKWVMAIGAVKKLFRQSSKPDT